ncbi:carboxypeptidase regulatory-like domain-containing protein [Nitrososphaera sp.]|uniref:carboxypeptidase regulatory-like domain-containing protein n=1 Tax=Nitrososphaera sp. TaxID=1971748 RepID=UPI0031727412
MTDAGELRKEFAELQKKYSEYLPKVDPMLVHDILLRQMENPGVAPIYMLEVFTKPGVNTEQARDYIFSKTGMSPAIFDNGTHYATNQKVTLEMLKEISDSDDVVEITGDYTGSIGAYPVSHEHRHREHPRVAQSSGQVAQLEPRVEVKMPTPEERKQRSSQYRFGMYVAGGIIGTIILAGAVISGGMLPNINVQSAAPGNVPGVLHGYVGGPGGLPAVGAAVVAAEQGTGHTVNEFVSVDGNYSFDLPPGNYIIVVAYPDGTNKIVNDYVVESGASHRLDFSY